jgi:dTDP-glucose 4,6-dehydratase
MATRKRILITGAAGFLGSHLCDRFIKEDFHVIGMDNLITGDLRNIEHLFKLENFEFYNHDVSTLFMWPAIWIISCILLRRQALSII